MSFHEVRFPANLSFGSVGGPERRTEIVRIQAEFFPRQYVERAFRIAHERVCEGAGLFDRQAARGVDEREFLGFRFRIFLKFVRFQSDLVLEHLALRAHRNEIPRRHGQRAGEQAGHAGGEYRAGTGRRAHHAEDQAGIRHQPVVDAEYRRAQVAAAGAPMPTTDHAYVGGHGVACRGAAVGREPAHFHGG